MFNKKQEKSRMASHIFFYLRDTTMYIIKDINCEIKENNKKKPTTANKSMQIT